MEGSDDEMYGFDSDEERLEYLSSLMDSEDTTQQQQPQSSADKDDLFATCDGSTSTTQAANKAAKLSLKKDEGGKGEETSAAVLQAELLKMKAEMGRMQKELEQQRQRGGSGGTTSREERCTPQQAPSVQRERRVAYPNIGNVSATLERLQSSASHKSVARRGKPLNGAGPPLPRKKTDRSSDEANITTEQFSKLRLRNATLTKADMAAKMEGRVMFKISRLATKMATNDLDGNWVTIGVIVAKLPPKDSSKIDEGFTLPTFRPAALTFFFRRPVQLASEPFVYQDGKRRSYALIMLMPAEEPSLQCSFVKGDKYSVWKLSDLSSVSNVVTLFLFGEAHKEHWKVSQGDVVAVLNPSVKAEPKKDRKSGGIPFTLSLDHPHKLMVLGQSHDYTQCQASVKSTSKRCNNFANLSEGGFCEFHVHGAYKQAQAKRGEFQSGYGPSNAAGLNRLKKKMKDENYFYCGASVASMSTGGGGAQGTSSSQRLFVAGAEEEAEASKRSYLENQRERPRVQQKGGIMVSEGSDLFKQIMQSQCLGARNLHKLLQQTEEDKNSKDLLSLSATEVLQRQRSKLQNTSQPSATKAASTCPPSAKTVLTSPMLGRGLKMRDNVVDLSEDIKPSKQKMKALSVLQKTGPIARVDPNSSSKGALSEGKKEFIRKRVLEGLAAPDGSGEEEKAEQPKKKSKLDTDRLRQAINAKSSHDWEVQEEEMEKQQTYFEYLEKKEAMEQMMQSVTEKRVTVFRCAKCHYTAEGASELCKKEAHSLVRFKATKRFFECKDCKQRKITYNETIPSKACTHCGGMNFLKTGMMKEKKGPLLESEGLLVRGEEEKFLK